MVINDEPSAKTETKPTVNKYALAYKVALGALIFITVAGAIIIFANNDPQSTNEALSSSEQKLGFSEDAKSSVCEQLTAEEVGQAIGETIGDTQRLLPDTNVEGGSVAGCKYVTQVRSGQKLESIGVVTQTFVDQTMATQMYQAQAANAEAIDGLAGSASYIAGSNPQLVIQNDNKISIITGVTTSADVTDIEAELTAVAKLL